VDIRLEEGQTNLPEGHTDLLFGEFPVAPELFKYSLKPIG
jgi:hypothetical protein